MLQKERRVGSWPDLGTFPAPFNRQSGPKREVLDVGFEEKRVVELSQTTSMTPTISWRLLPQPCGFADTAACGADPNMPLVRTARRRLVSHRNGCTSPTVASSHRARSENGLLPRSTNPLRRAAAATHSADYTTFFGSNPPSVPSGYRLASCAEDEMAPPSSQPLFSPCRHLQPRSAYKMDAPLALMAALSSPDSRSHQRCHSDRRNMCMSYVDLGMDRLFFCLLLSA